MMRQLIEIHLAILNALFIVLFTTNYVYSHECNPPCSPPQVCDVNAECVDLPGSTSGARGGGSLVELSLFEALFRRGKVTVYWTTESERDTAGFDIERSLQPHEGYEKLNDTMIPAEGDTITGAEYSFVDNNIKREKYYYQLKEYELNGKINYYGPTNIDLRPKGKTKPPKTKKSTPQAENTTPEQKGKSTEQEILTTPSPATGSSDAENNSTEENKIPYVLVVQQETKSAKKPSSSPKGWIKTPFPITITGKDKGRAGNKKNSMRWQPTTTEQEANGPAKTIAWSEVANVIYVSQRNLSNKELFLKLVDGKVIVVNKTNPDYFRFADTIENERQLTERLKEIGVHDTKSILTIWRESHENKQ